MRHIRRFAVLQRKGMALLLVMFVAFASLVLLTTLFASVAPRRASVSGELQADRALAVADGKIDLIMNTINTFPQLSVSGYVDENSAQAAIVAGWEGMLNGYASDSNSLTNASNVSTYFYHTTTDTWYAAWNIIDTSYHLMSIPAATKLGREVGPADITSDTVLALRVWNLSTNTLEPSSIIEIDSNCRTNNEWFEVDTNASYNDTPTDVWTMRASAYLLSRTGIVRTLEAKAAKKVNAEKVAEYNWWYTSVTRSPAFSDYVFLDNFDVNFGKYAEVNGPVRANGTVNMGGWAKYPVTSTEHVTDIAVDDGNRNDGRFGLDKKSLSWAKQTINGYAVDHAPPISWLEVDKALVGSNPERAFGADTGMQDKAIEPYYVDGNATLTFSVVSGVGKVTIKIGTGSSTTYDMPTNGVIYVKGNATVKGNVKGSCMVGASGNISLGGDILYNTQPRTGENDPLTTSHDFLGLVANGNIVIPYSTYQADKHLIIDGAMVADGWLGTDSDDWSWHNLNTNPSTAPTLVVRGSMAAGNGQHMMVTFSGSQIKGYDMRQYNFDWNLKQLGVPDGFPTTGSGTTVPTETGVTDETLLNQLKLTDPSMHPVGNPVNINGTAYYAREVTAGGTSTSWNGFVTNGMYRIGWKEQIGEPVGGN